MTKNHPKGLYILFFTEMWERFSYYGMRALLMLYLVKHIKYSDEKAGNIYGAYTGLVYLTPIIGGYIADRYIGSRKAVFIGGILMMLGHLSLAMDNIELFFAGLLFLILGNGFFKPNISTMLGTLYEKTPELKDSGFTIFYMGINLGGFAGPLLCGYLGEVYGWHYGFGLAGIGMLSGLLVFKFGAKNLGTLGSKPLADHFDKTASKLTRIEKQRISVIVILSVFTLFFWLAFEQAGSSMNLYADRYMNREIAGEIIPASIFQSVNGLLILLLAPLFAWIWIKLGLIGKEPNTTLKFSLGFLFLGLGFLALVIGSENIESGIKANMFWLLLAYLLHTIGELCLSPVGLSMVSKLSPVKFSAMLMGIWFLSNAFAHYLAGFLSGRISKFSSIADFFLLFVYTSLACGIILFLLNKKLTSMMHIDKGEL